MWRRLRKALLWAGVGLFVLALLLVLAGALLQGRLREYAEQQLNAKVPSYRFELGGLRLHPLRLGVELTNLTVRQRDHPEPPIAQVGSWTARLQWSAILHGAIVSDQQLQTVRVSYTRPQAKTEAQHVQKGAEQVQQVEAKEKKSWQAVLFSLYPVTINQFELRDGDVTYLDAPRARPLHLTNLHVQTGNIRNVRSKQGEYPADLLVEATVNGQGKLHIKGQADFFAEPYPAVHADVAVQQLDLRPAASIAERYHVKVHDGRLGVQGHVDIAPWRTVVHLSDVRLEQALVNYLYQPEAPKPEKETAKKTAEKTAEKLQQPQVRLRIDRAVVSGGEFGVVHAGVDPPYRVFLSDVKVDASNVSNRITEGVAKIVLTGQFMGSGKMEARGVFRPELTSPDFDLSVEIEGTDTRRLNDVLRAHSKMDVANGQLAVYSQLRVKDGKVEGYVKPLLTDLRVFEPGQERGKGLGTKLKEAAADVGARSLQRPFRQQAGTKVDISGTLKSPEIGTWDAAMRLLGNAFVRAVLPGFERPARPSTEAGAGKASAGG